MNAPVLPSSRPSRAIARQGWPLVVNPSLQVRLIWWSCTLLATAVFAVLFVDSPVANAIARHSPVDKLALWVAAVKMPGNFRFTVALSLLIFWIEKRRVVPALLPILSGGAGGLIYLVLKWVVGRRRPVYFEEQHLGSIAPWNHAWFIGGLRGLYDESALCFPSGHATLTFATATSLAICYPRWSWVWFSIAAAVSMERVLENAHFLSDTIVGMAAGILCTVCVARVIELWSRRVPGLAPLALARSVGAR